MRLHSLDHYCVPFQPVTSMRQRRGAIARGENVSGTKPSDDAGKGGAGAESSGKKPARNQTPPSDQSGSQKASGSGNGGG